MPSHEFYISETFNLARSAQEKGNHPFGALFVLDEKIILSAENTAISTKDITRHAELNLVSQLSQQLTPERIAQGILYTSTEPCAMCAGAIYWAGINTIVYGCSATCLAEIAGVSLTVACCEVLADTQRQIRLIGPLLEAEGIAIHRAFW